MKANLKLIAGPSEDPVTVADAKDYLRIDNSSEDARILTMIKAATISLESFVGQKFISQVWDVFLDGFEAPKSKNDPWWDGSKDGPISMFSGQCSNIYLPIGPMISLDEFSTYGDDGVAVNAQVSDYIADTIGPRARVGLKLGGLWPTTVLRSSNGVRFRLTVGISANAATLPSDIRQAVLEFIAHMYENRGDQNEMKIPPHVMTLIEHRRALLIG